MPLAYTKAENFPLQNNREYSEQWIQRQIMEDSSILGLGDLELVAAEKIQPKAGRLDLLLHDEQLNRRYEVELMLGATDPNHIIRCIEYWDIERRRYPAYEHVAVLVAENITSRFLNVMSLLAGSIPLIAIQVNALKIEEKIVLHFVRVMDQTELRTDDVYEGGASGGGIETVDRNFWETKSSEGMMHLCDRLLSIFNSVSEQELQLKYVKNYVAVSTAGAFFNVAKIFPRKSHGFLVLPVEDVKSWLSKLEEAGIDAQPRKANLIRLGIRPHEFESNKPILEEIIQDAVEVSQSC